MPQPHYHHLATTSRQAPTLAGGPAPMPPRRRPLLLFLLLLALACSGGRAAVDNATSTPLACSELARVCTAFLAFPAASAANANASVLGSMFDASPDDLTADAAASPGYAFVRKNCSCLASRTYLANTTYTIPSAVPPNATAAQVAAAAYAGLAIPPPGGAAQRPPRPGAVLALHLICGCSSGPWNYLLTYVGADGDTVESLSSRFGASMDAIEAANGMAGPDPISTGKVYYIPLNSGEPMFTDRSEVLDPLDCGSGIVNTGCKPITFLIARGCTELPTVFFSEVIQNMVRTGRAQLICDLDD